MVIATQLSDPGPAAREIDKLEHQRKALVLMIEDKERDYVAARTLSQITEKDIRDLF